MNKRVLITHAVQLIIIILLVFFSIPLSVPLLGNLRVNADAYSGSIEPVEDYQNMTQVGTFSEQISKIGDMKSALFSVLKFLGVIILILCVLSALVWAATYGHKFWKTIGVMLLINAGLFVCMLIYLWIAVRVVSGFAPESISAMLIVFSVLFIGISFIGTYLRVRFVQKKKFSFIAQSKILGLWIVLATLFYGFLKILPADPRLKMLVFAGGILMFGAAWVAIRMYAFSLHNAS